MSFATELWDQVKAVEQYLDTGDQYMNKTNDFLKSIIASEQQYAASLNKASKVMRDEYLKKSSDKSVVVNALLGSANYQLCDFNY